MDQLTMDFVAYNENKCSQEAVLDYIIYLILREKEPQMVEVGTALILQCSLNAIPSCIHGACLDYMLPEVQIIAVL